MTRYNFAIHASALAMMISSCAGEITQPQANEAAGTSPSGIPLNPGTGLANAVPGAAGSGASNATAVPPTTSGAVGRLNLAGSPQYFRVMALTKSQWLNSVEEIFGLTSPPASAQTFQDAVSGTTDFTNNELVLDVDSRGWNDYQSAAEEVAQLVAGDPANLSKLYAGTDAAGFISSIGRRLYRRTLTSQEIARLQPLFDAGAASSGNASSFATGAEMVLEAMLQSPHFLYRTELGLPGTPLSGYEVAAKLSLWLLDTSPDVALLDAAERGELDTPQGVSALASKMLEEPAALEVMRKFHGQLLHLGRFSELSKFGVAAYDPAINSELMESAYRFFDKIFTGNRGLADVFLATSGFVGPQMASFYGLAPSGSELTDRELGPGRVGFFTQLPYVMLYAHNDEPDAIHRGVNMALDVLCAPLGPPAATIPPLPMRMPGQTNRMRVDAHTSGCGGACHNDLINPLGFAFENFDGMGQYRTNETHGSESLPIDASGSFKFIDGMKSWTNASELMQLLATEPQTHICYAKKLASFGLQRDIVDADMPLLEAMANVSETGSVKQLIVKLVETDTFRNRAGGTL